MTWLHTSLLFVSIVAYRLVNVLIINTQFDPDEFWQTLEPAYCLAYSSSSEQNCALTWEWKRRMINGGEGEGLPNTYAYLGTFINEALHGPVRSFVPILPTYFLYKMLQMTHLDSTWMVAKAPLLLNAVFVAAPTDFAVYYVSKFIFGRTNENATRNDMFYKVETWALILTLTNWFNGYCLVRTYSNSLETVLISIGLVILCPELFGNVQIKDKFQVRFVARVAFLLGGLSVVIRFTALAAWIPIGLIICARRKSIKSSFYYLWHICILPGLTGVVLGCIIDRYFYGFWAIPFLGSFHFNALLGKGSLYGTHPWFWYIVAGLPAIGGIATPLFLFEDLRSTFQRGQVAFLNHPESVLLVIIRTYIGFHSISPHKEFRFILPILPLIFVLSANAMQSVFERQCARTNRVSRTKIIMLSVLFLFNYPHLIFLCTSHQSAPVQINRVITRFINDSLKDNLSAVEPIHIHYLMGCHSTPLYSHLHIASNNTHYNPISINAWYLDCSPECRSDKSILCESDRFTKDPLGFIAKEYELINDTCISYDNEECVVAKDDYVRGERKVLPHYLAVFEEDLEKNSTDVETLLKNNGMVKTERIRHTVSGVSLSKGIARQDKNVAGSILVKLPLFGKELTISFQHMVLFTRP